MIGSVGQFAHSGVESRICWSREYLVDALIQVLDDLAQVTSTISICVGKLVSKLLRNSTHGVNRMENPRLAAALTLILMIIGFGWLVATAIGSFPFGLIAVVLIAAGFEFAWEALRRTETAQTVFSVLSILCLVAALLAMLRGGLILDLVFVVLTLVGSTLVAKLVFRPQVRLPTARRPDRAVVLWNPNSGGGKAKAADLPGEARRRGIEPIELSPGDDLEQLARQAVANGADALAAAGGDGTQAVVASVASEYDLPFACIPAGTRNHFALDLGVNRDDVVGALDAFVDGRERRVDLADVNGRVFVNNVSIGLYADAVQRGLGWAEPCVV